MISSPTMRPSQSVIPTLISAQPSSTKPSSAQPSYVKIIVNPTTLPPIVQPTLVPSNLPTQIPSNILTPTPTQSDFITNSKASSSESKMSTTNMAAVISCIIVLLFMIVICFYIINKKTNNKLSPYEEWISYYSEQNRKSNVLNATTDYPNNDIHHFYAKQNRLQPPIFTPHSPMPRNSKIGAKRQSYTHYNI
jgi:hypothetical protein